MKFDNLTATPILREIKYWLFQTVQNVIYDNFRNCELGILVNLRLESGSKLQKSKSKTSKIAIDDIFGPFECTKI